MKFNFINKEYFQKNKDKRYKAVKKDANIYANLRFASELKFLRKEMCFNCAVPASVIATSGIMGEVAYATQNPMLVGGAVLVSSLALLTTKVSIDDISRCHKEIKEVKAKYDETVAMLMEQAGYDKPKTKSHRR